MLEKGRIRLEAIFLNGGVLQSICDLELANAGAFGAKKKGEVKMTR